MYSSAFHSRLAAPHFRLILALALIFGVCALSPARADSSETAALKIEGTEAAKTPLYAVEFSDYTEGSVEEWLLSKGFVFEKDANSRRLIRFDLSDDGLIVEAKKQARGFLFDELGSVEGGSKVRITWGILKYPEGASYENGVNNEALMVYFFFGHEKMPSGSLLLPDSPYFIGLFLSEEDAVGKAYVGNHYQAGGRFVCIGNPPPGETVVSEFDLAKAFRTYFKKEKVPVVSGISIGVDTASAGDGGRSGAFVKRIEFLD